MLSFFFKSCLPVIMLHISLELSYSLHLCVCQIISFLHIQAQAAPVRDRASQQQPVKWCPFIKLPVACPHVTNRAQPTAVRGANVAVAKCARGERTQIFIRSIRYTNYISHPTTYIYVCSTHLPTQSKQANTRRPTHTLHGPFNARVSGVCVRTCVARARERDREGVFAINPYD